MDNHSMKGKSGLIRDVIRKGFSVRRAIKGVNAVFDCMARAVRRGEVVQIPVGTIRPRAQKGKPVRRLQKLYNLQTGTSRWKLAKFPGKRRVVNFRPDLNLDLTPPPVPPTPEEVECRILAAELLGRRAVDDRTMARLQQSADFPPTKPGNLLNRLKEAKSRGWYASSTDELVSTIRLEMRAASYGDVAKRNRRSGLRASIGDEPNANVQLGKATADRKT